MAKESASARKARLAREAAEREAKEKAKLEAEKQAEENETVVEEQSEVKEEQLEVVVKEEVKKEETVQPQPTVVKENETKVRKKITNFEELVEDKKDDKVVGRLVTSLERYVNIVFKKNPNDGETVASMNYELYNIIKGIFGEEDYSVFKAKLTLLNRVFLLERNRYFNPVALSKYDFFWGFGNESRIGYHMLIEFLSEMANPNTRKARSKNFSINALVKHLPEGSMAKLTKFYGL